MRLRYLICASLAGIAALPATAGIAEVRQKASPDAAAPARSSFLPQFPRKTATPRSNITEETPTAPMQTLATPEQPIAAPPAAASPPPRSAITR